MYFISGVFDDAGTDQHSKVQVMGGYVALVQQWQLFQPRWRQLLADNHIPHLHAFKFAASKPPYDTWSGDKKRQFIADAAEIFKTGLIFGMSSILRNEDYDAVFKQGPPIRKGRLDSKRGLCFRVLILNVMNLLELNQRTRDARVQFVVDAGSKNAGDLVRIMEEMKAHERGSHKPWSVEGLSFQWAKDFQPLQAADLFAFCTKQESQRIVYQFPGPMLQTLVSAATSEGHNMHLQVTITRDMLANLRLTLASNEGRIVNFGRQQHEAIMRRIAQAKAKPQDS